MVERYFSFDRRQFCDARLVGNLRWCVEDLKDSLRSGKVRDQLVVKPARFWIGSQNIVRYIANAVNVPIGTASTPSTEIPIKYRRNVPMPQVTSITAENHPLGGPHG